MHKQCFKLISITANKLIQWTGHDNMVSKASSWVEQNQSLENKKPNRTKSISENYKLLIKA